MAKTTQRCKFIRKCGQCIRNDDYKVFNHPAIANKVLNVNDEISIDWSWGFEKTKEGFEGTMYIQDEVSKRVSIYKMKTKLYR